jgi:hypothetical protein
MNLRSKGGKPVNRFIILALAGAILLSACAPAAAPTGVPDVAPAEPLPQATQPEVAPAGPGAADPPGATPTARRGLEATDPTSVTLGAGQPVLLEFFAFW